ncbi:MAG: PINc/VapC family ATPase [Halobacteriaceae archaeon]
MKIVPDTSVVVDGRVSELVADGELAGARIIVPEAVVSELEAQANAGRQTGWDGLEELQRLADLADAGDIELDYVGERPGESEIERAAAGAIDARIRDVAVDHEATFLTSDIVQGEVAEAKGIDTRYLEPEAKEETPLTIESFFDEETMSLHLREGVVPMAKRGTVGDITFEQVGDEELTGDEMRQYAAEIIDTARSTDRGFVDFDEPGMTIVQIGEYRIAVAEPPFSDAHEITAVRPLVKTVLDDYEHADELRERLLERDRGVLIAGSPGAGKSTFAQSVAEFLADEGFVIKTMEKPRDLDVSDDITQYTELRGSMERTADSLLMVRPDYTIYDEVRKTEDFEVFADIRLAGVGLVGVVHATRPIDALQRLVGRVELGMIPQVVDTVVFIEDGEVETIYDVVTEVKVPEGLMEEDLARPVILVRDFETGQPDYEIYTFNRQVVTVPLGETEEEPSGVESLAEVEIEREIQSLVRGPVEVEVKGPNEAVVYVSDDDISYVIGKGGGRISDVEDRLGVNIDVRTFEEKPEPAAGGDAGSGGGGGGGGHAGDVVTPEVTGRHVIVPMGQEHAGETVEVRADGEYLFTATVGRGGDIQVSRGSAIAEELERAIDREQRITVVPS